MLPKRQHTSCALKYKIPHYLLFKIISNLLFYPLLENHQDAILYNALVRHRVWQDIRSSSDQSTDPNHLLESIR